jgi:hypothetical protein
MEVQMNKVFSSGAPFLEVAKKQRYHPDSADPATHQDIVRLLKNEGHSQTGSWESLPFSLYDTTAGSETELQAVVSGPKGCVDLPLTIEGSDYYANIMRRASSGDSSKKLVTSLERFLNENSENIWESSLVRFPRKNLTPFADSIFRHDLLSNKASKKGSLRSDMHEFILKKNGEDYLRLPISYLLKLSLADVISSESVPRIIQRTGHRLMGCFTNDNTSPETYSFHTMLLSPETGMGRVVAKEMAFRFLLSQLLIMYANEKFGLKESGQEAMVYMSPHTPVRQKKLNECISDSFYRELFMSPCLSGWDEGEAKHAYMHLCHEVLSRSQLNGVVKLRDSGIIFNNLVVLPNTSNTSLANNGTHVSIGSRRLSNLLQDKTSGFTQVHEKYVSDLVVKITEHFLPLFTCLYSASPYRIDFFDFHPEKVLAFLPHEIDYTHLRMLWRRWKKKAKNKFFGHALTPFGPIWLDRFLSAALSLKGDIIPDFRLIDYLVCLMSTERSPALNGIAGNTAKLKKDLADMGVFHQSMSLYLFYKPREFNVMGFSGFEGRHYSLFESFEKDIGHAISLQNLITALAFRYILEGKVTHGHIPDSPFIESERRQIIFNSAIGIPTFYVRADSPNLFLKSILSRTQKIRNSRRYPGYFRVKLDEYIKALYLILSEDAHPLIEMLSMEEVIMDLKERLSPGSTNKTSSKLIEGILNNTGADSLFDMQGEQFNLAAEQFYRGPQKIKHMEEAFKFLKEEFLEIDKGLADEDESVFRALGYLLKGAKTNLSLDLLRDEIIKGEADLKHIVQTIFLMLIVEHREEIIQRYMRDNYDTAPVYRAGNA